MSSATLLRHFKTLSPRVFLRQVCAVAPWRMMVGAGRLAPWSAPALGMVAHGLRPRLDRPLNAQCVRETLTRELIAAFGPVHIIETGTYRGATTEFFASWPGVSVWSCELTRFYHQYAKRRLRRFANVHLARGDSAEFLERLAANAALTAQPCFFYLDAHWYEDLPLAKEMRTIRDHWQNVVILVDDFEVPGDSGYQFDDYTGAGRLCLATLDSVIDTFDVYFPRLPSTVESGPKRGCVVFAGGAARSVLRTCVMLKPDAVGPHRPAATPSAAILAQP